jgi:hypothetical protein
MLSFLRKQESITYPSSSIRFFTILQQNSPPTNYQAFFAAKSLPAAVFQYHPADPNGGNCANLQELLDFYT